MQALDLWHEPVDLLETGEGLFNGCTELLMDLAAKSEALLAEKAPCTRDADICTRDSGRHRREADRETYIVRQ
jgi:hypothetical protein